MKKRLGFVSNSSSSSFVAVVSNNSDTTINIKKYINDNIGTLLMEIMGVGKIVDVLELTGINEEQPLTKKELKDKELLLNLIRERVDIRVDNIDIPPNEKAILHSYVSSEDWYRDIYMEAILLKENKENAIDLFTTSLSC